MTQSPLSPTLPPNTEFVQHYIDSLENLPLEIQRHVTNLREYDLLCRNKMEQVGRYLVLYRNSNSGPGKKKFLNKIQKCLIKSQQYGDDKLNIISQIVEMVEARTQQVTKDALRVDLENKEETNRTTNQIITTNHRMKMEKSIKITEKPPKNIYEKPKRQARRARITEKLPEKVEKNNSAIRYMNKEEVEEEEEEDEEIEEEEEAEVKVKKEVKRKEKVKEKEKEKEKVKEEKEERKDERKATGKVTRKSTPKHVSSKIKKKKKKEKESTIEDVPVDPDEPTYCICNSISYGDMIGCDNDDCEIEWFHFCCVNLTHKPKGKWYCPRCSAERKEKGKK